MITSEKDIYIQEMEIKPNRYAGRVLAFTFAVVLSCWILNEMGIFRVEATQMRVGAAVAGIVTLIPAVLLLFSRKLLRDPRMKYVVILAATAFTFVEVTLLTFHTMIMLLFPILFAMLYRSKPLGFVATVASFVCTILCPVLGYMLGTWEIPLFEELISIGTNGGVVTVVGGGGGISAANIGKIILYLVLPRLMLVGSCALLLFNIIRLGVDHVNNQILLNRLSNLDALTGLYNQNCYRSFVETEEQRSPEIQVGVLFFDVNDLKHLNDAKGHEAGDLLLQRCAESLLQVCDGETAAAFRAGGDEFVIIMENADKAALDEKLTRWEAALARINEENRTKHDGLECSMAVGCDFGKSSELENLIQNADAMMYCDKSSRK